ncbi:MULTISPECIES: DUF7115 domain-containing protein [Halorussus]|uniref:DUF7115 domain-containing protein n=1 Tax=Halorussus TaxID=1070314 RepID=UPI0020A0C22C|nr:hypothetical protein [Halorussus vallis]USZ76980.1 hypothetical protein NGM07_06535 [Halorussus vallis]
MSVPGIVQSRLDGEQVAAQVSLGGEDALFVTPTRTLIYRADGLLSDESVESYAHDAERIEVSEGRRKSAIALDYGIDGSQKFKIPTNRLYEALHPVLAGVLNAADVTGSDETVKQTYQFSELTLVITSERVVKHVGAAVWDQDYEEFPFADVTALDVEEGSVSSQIIIEVDGRPQRIKTPSDQTREVRERIERALLAHHGMASYEEFAREHADPEDHAEAEREADADVPNENDPLAGGVDPIEANPPELDESGAIIEDDVSVTTGERAVDANAEAGAEASTGAESADSASAPASSAHSDAAGSDAAGSSAGADRGTAATEADSGETDPRSAAGESAAAADSPVSATETVEATETTAATETAEVNGESDASEAADPGESADGTGGFADSGFEPASSDFDDGDTEARLDALAEAVERHNELLARQQETLETLVDELRRGR